VGVVVSLVRLVVRTIRPKCFNRLCSNSLRAAKSNEMW
jgi:hypothetical protein